jgi:iron complex outermembrane recepter protein
MSLLTAHPRFQSTTNKINLMGVSMKRTRSFSATKFTVLASAISAVLAGYTSSSLAADDELEEITVTGSRIVRRDLSAPSPIVTVGTEKFENSSTTGMESVLNQMPQFAPAGTQFATGFQGSATATPGAATLNLRGLGANRNLVLIDGRRGQPANASLVIDINTIPAAAIQNVEVISGGASAVYGPDAMAGVVNFVLKNNFEGAEFDFQTGETFEGDGMESKFSALFGVNSGDGKGNIMIGLDWTKRESVLQADREFYRNGWLDPGNPGGQFMQATSYAASEAAIPGGRSLPTQAVVNSLFPQLAAGAVGNTSEFRFNDDGSLFVSQQGYGYKGPLGCLEGCGSFTGVKKLTNGNLDQFGTVGFASTPLERHSFFAKGSYDLTDSVSAFMQTNYSNVEVITRGGIPPAITVWQAPVQRDSRALPAALNTLLDSRANPAGPWSLYQVLDYNGPIEPINKTNTWQMLAGLKGDLMEGDWSWEAYVSRGNTNTLIDHRRLPSLQRYQWLVNQKDFGKGTFAGSGRGYVVTCDTGLPVFKEFTPTQNCFDIIDTRMINQTTLGQEIAEANLQGGLFELPAGEVRFAAGVTWRKNTFEYQPGNSLNEVLDNPIGVFASNGTAGETDVREVYGEMLVPVLDSLNLELGYRYSDFNTAGGIDTYKTLFTWDVMDSVSIRGGYQFATRAPNTAELFLGPTSATVTFANGDPCSVTTRWPYGNVAANPNRQKVQDLCRAIIGNNTSGFDTQTYSTTGIAGPNGFHRQNPPYFPLENEINRGNANVKPEEGETWTLGAVVEEPFGVERLSFTVDVYNIELTDAIAPENSVAVYSRCLNADGSNPTYSRSNVDCLKIRRNASTGDREEVDALYSNLGLLKTRGVDLQVNWGRDIGPGTFNASSTINYLDEFLYQTSPTSAIVDATGTLDQGGQYDYRVFTNFSYVWENFNIGLNWRHLAAIEDASKALAPTGPILGTGSYNVFALNGGYTWDKYSLRFGIDNLLDEEPRVIGANPGVDTNTDATNPGYYDILGRRWYMGVKVSF